MRKQTIPLLAIIYEDINSKQLRGSMTSIEELDELCAHLVEMKRVKADMKDALSAHEKEFKALQFKIINLLESLDKHENEGRFGKVKIQATKTFRMTDKDQTFGWLKEQGKFDDLASVNQASLSAWIKQEYANDIDAGIMVDVPGVEDKTGDYAFLKITEI